jgi:hypothetical protein
MRIIEEECAAAYARGYAASRVVGEAVTSHSISHSAGLRAVIAHIRDRVAPLCDNGFMVKQLDARTIREILESSEVA